MPTIPEYGEQLRQRRQQLETVRSEVSSQQFQKPKIQQRVLRQLTPLTSLKVRKQIGKMRGEFDISKNAALGEIEQGFREQEQLESEFAPMEAQYNQYLQEVAAYEQAKAAEKLASKSGTGYSAYATGAEKKALKGIAKAKEAYMAAPQLKITVSEEGPQFLPGVIVRDFTNKKMKPEYISPDTGEKFKSFEELKKSFEIPAVANFNYSAPEYNEPSAITGFALKAIESKRPISNKSFGIRPTNINMLGSIGRSIYPNGSKKSNLAFGIAYAKKASNLKTKAAQTNNLFGRRTNTKTKGIRWL